MKFYCDGSGWNGERSRYAIVSEKETHVIELREERTNNVMEYAAAIRAATLANNDDTIITDSQLVVKQVSGEYKVREISLKVFRQALWDICQRKNLILKWVPRNENIAGKLLDRIKMVNL